MQTIFGNTETSVNVMKFQRSMNHKESGPAATAHQDRHFTCKIEGKRDIDFLGISLGR